MADRHAQKPVPTILSPLNRHLVRTDPRYPVEAYEFVCDAVAFTQEAFSDRLDVRRARATAQYTGGLGQLDGGRHGIDTVECFSETRACGRSADSALTRVP